MQRSSLILACALALGLAIPAAAEFQDAMTPAPALVKSKNLSDLPNKTTARSNLGVAIGTQVEAWSANLDALAAKTVPSGTLADLTTAQTFANKSISGASNTFSNIPFTAMTGNATAGQGGTGLTTYTIGDILYASGSTSLAQLNDVAAGSVLVSGGVATAPAWSANPSVTSLTVAMLNLTNSVNDTSTANCCATSGGSLTGIAAHSTYIGIAASTIATFTFTMEASPAQGRRISFVGGQHTVTAFTVNANSGQTIFNAPTTLANGTAYTCIYVSTTWYCAPGW